MVKNLPVIWETWVQSLGWEGPLGKGTATHSSVLAWRIPWTESLVGYSPWACRLRHHGVTFTSLQQRCWEWTMSSWENVQNGMRKGLRQILEVLGVVEILEWGRR